jgi:hypothetical protein
MRGRIGVVEMIDAVLTFLKKIKEQEHVLPLIQHADLQVTFHIEQDTTLLAIKNGEIFILQKFKDPLHNSVISGDIIAMEQLLEGKETLRFLASKGELKVSAPFRTTLLLESIFYLTNPEKPRHPCENILNIGFDIN